VLKIYVYNTFLQCTKNATAFSYWRSVTNLAAACDYADLTTREKRTAAAVKRRKGRDETRASNRSWR
jgi:hypothetical protein